MTDEAGLLASVLALCDQHPALGVAVSGGGDSLALLHLMAQMALPRGQRLQAATVDHGLRADSAQEADFVSGICRDLGVPHRILRWDRRPVSGNLMAQARDARFDLLGNWAREAGLDVVALGHTADDQAEGFLMALSRAAGLDGLSGMRPKWHQDGLTWARPLLPHSRASLRSYLTGCGLRWIDDPSNDNPRFQRVRMRKALALLAPLGLTTDKIAASVGHLHQTRAMLAQDMVAFAQRHVREIAGALEITRSDLAARDPEFQRRFLSAALRWIGGADHAPRADALARMRSAAQTGRSATLAGVRLRASQSALRLSREPRAVGGPIPPGKVWDKRWVVTGPAQAEVRALGAAGLAQIEDWRALGLPRDALIVTPALWHEARLLAAPVAKFGDGATASLRQSFTSFLITH